MGMVQRNGERSERTRLAENGHPGARSLVEWWETLGGRGVVGVKAKGE